MEFLLRETLSIVCTFFINKGNIPTMDYLEL